VHGLAAEPEVVAERAGGEPAQRAGDLAFQEVVRHVERHEPALPERRHGADEQVVLQLEPLQRRHPRGVAQRHGAREPVSRQVHGAESAQALEHRWERAAERVPVQAERGEVRGAAERVARERSRQLRAVEGQGNHAAIGVARHAKPPAAPAVARRPGPVGVQVQRRPQRVAEDQQAAALVAELIQLLLRLLLRAPYRHDRSKNRTSHEPTPWPPPAPRSAAPHGILDEHASSSMHEETYFY
jgi:hypothetical protein